MITLIFTIFLNKNNLLMDFANRTSTSFKSNRNFQFSAKSNFFNNDQETLVKGAFEKETYTVSNKIITDDEWETITNFITHSNSVRALEFSGINISGNGLKSLAEIINKNQNIKTLTLEWNYLNEYPDDFDYFCEVLSHCNHLTYLYLKNNKINSNLAKNSLIKIVKANEGMLYFDLRWNEIGNEGAKAIMTVLGKNNSLQDLILMGNKIEETLIKEINEKLNRNKNLNYNYYVNNEKGKLSTSQVMISKDPVVNFEEKLSYEPPFNNSMKFLEKEKEITEELKARYDVQIISNSKLEKRIKELEIMLNNERSKVDEIRNQTAKELQNEKDMRFRYEEQVLKLKEDLMKKEIDYNKNLQELEIKISNIFQENANYINDNKLLKDMNERIRGTYEEKYKGLEENYNKNANFLNDNIDNLRSENEKIRKEFQDDLKNMHRDWERKLKGIEESYKNMKFQKDELEKELTNSKKDFLDFKIDKEMEYKDRETKLLEEESRKYESCMKNYEQRLKVLEAGRDEFIQKTSLLNQEIQNLKKASTEEQINYENKINTLSIEKINLEKKNTNLLSQFNKTTSDNNIKEAMITKLKNDILDLNKTFEKQNASYNNQIENAVQEYNNGKKQWHQEKDNLYQKIKELENLVENLKVKMAKFESDDMKFSETLKKTFVKYIDDNFKEKYKI